MNRAVVSLCLAFVVAVQPLMCCCVVAEVLAATRPALAATAPAAPPCCCCPEAKAPTPHEAPAVPPCQCEKTLANAVPTVAVAAPADDAAADLMLAPTAAPMVCAAGPDRPGAVFPFFTPRDFLNRCHFLRC